MKIIILIIILIILVFLNKTTKILKVEIGNINKNIIPKKLIQTYHLPDKIPDYIHDNIKKYCSDYEYYFFDDSDWLNFIKEHYTDPVVNKYNSLSGPHKADLLRYCILYIYGGVYADIKTIFIKNINTIFDHTTFSKKHKFYSVVCDSHSPDCIYQGIIATSQYNPIFLILIEKILHTHDIIINNNYHVFVNQMYNTLEELKDDPEYQIILFNEICTTDISGTTNKLDRYGFYCQIIDNDNNHIFDTRDPKYPWT